MKDLSLLEMKNINGGSSLTYYVYWFLGRSFISAAELNKNGMNPVHMHN